MTRKFKVKALPKKVVKTDNRSREQLIDALADLGALKVHYSNTEDGVQVSVDVKNEGSWTCAVGDLEDAELLALRTKAKVFDA